MSLPEVTPWFPPSEKPLELRPGDYQAGYYQMNGKKLSEFLLIDLAEPVRTWNGNKWLKSKRHGEKPFAWRGLTAPHPEYKDGK